MNLERTKGNSCFPLLCMHLGLLLDLKSPLQGRITDRIPTHSGGISPHQSQIQLLLINTERIV